MIFKSFLTYFLSTTRSSGALQDPSLWSSWYVYKFRKVPEQLGFVVYLDLEFTQTVTAPK